MLWLLLWLLFSPHSLFRHIKGILDIFLPLSASPRRKSVVVFNDKQFFQSSVSPTRVAVTHRRGTRLLERNSCALTFPISKKLLIERRTCDEENIYKKKCDGKFEIDFASKTNKSIWKSRWPRKTIFRWCHKLSQFVFTRKVKSGAECHGWSFQFSTPSKVFLKFLTPLGDRLEKLMNINFRRQRATPGAISKIYFSPLWTFAEGSFALWLIECSAYMKLKEALLAAFYAMFS